jgi:hypothetical protein
VLYSGERIYAPSLPGISVYDTLHALSEKLGPPSSVSHSKDELRRMYSFEKYNIVVEFVKNEVVALGIFDPATGPMRFSDEAK